MTIATAKVATSAEEARDLGLLKKVDRISMNKDRQIADAKQTVIELALAGYTMPQQAKKHQGPGVAPDRALFLAGLQGMLMGAIFLNMMRGGQMDCQHHVREVILLHHRKYQNNICSISSAKRSCH